MNRLQLVQRLFSECDVNDTVPATTISQTGEAADMVNWIDAAWTLIQSQFKWAFLWEQPTLTVLSGTGVLAQTIPPHRYERESCRFLVANGQRLRYIPWAAFDERYPAIDLTSTSAPNTWSIRPDNAFVVNALVAADTAFVLQRYKNPIAMTADTDIPALDVEHHVMIVWRAMMYYAQHEEAGAIYRTGKANYNECLELLGLTATPDWSFGPALLSC